MTQETNVLTLPDEGQFIRDIQAINRFQKVVHSNMVNGQDYGIIPGTQKPTLLKPGAEKIAKLLGLSDQYEIIDRQEVWEGKPFFRYLVRCILRNVSAGIVISEGLGECNSMESKYRWREAKKKCPNCGKETIIKGKDEYGGGWICWKSKGGCGSKWEDGASEIESQPSGKVENEDIYSQVNTILKMAKKRALVDAALSAGRLSEVFTQDVEDLTDTPIESTARVVEPQRQAAKELKSTADQRTKMFAAAGQQSISNEDLHKYIKHHYGIDSSKDLTKKQAGEIIDAIETGNFKYVTEESQPML